MQATADPQQTAPTEHHATDTDGQAAQAADDDQQLAQPRQLQQWQPVPAVQQPEHPAFDTLTPVEFGRLMAEEIEAREIAALDAERGEL